MEKKTKSALENTVAWLAARPYSIMELKRKLYSKKIYSGAEVEYAISEAIRYGFLNDETYAESAVSTMKNRGYGNRRINMKLRDKGVTKEIATQAIEADDELEGRDQLTTAKEILRRRMRTLNAVQDRNKRRDKALRLLAGRGFDSSTTYSAVNLFMNGQLENDTETES